MRKGNNFKRNFVSYRINNEIHAAQVRLLDDKGVQIGVLSMPEALKMAEEKTLDLVEVAPTAKPPVVKLIDYNKFLYQLKKKKQEEKKGAHVSETKQVQFGPFIDEHDLEIKLSRAREFISDGDKVRFVVKFRGREMTKQDLGRQVLSTVVSKMEDIAKVEQQPKMEGRQLIMVMSKGAVKKEEVSEQVAAQTATNEPSPAPTENLGEIQNEQN